MAVTKRYAVYCRGELIGEYTAVDAAEMLKCTPGTVRTYASGGNKLYGEYTFEVVESEEKAVRPWPKCDDWSEEWERAGSKPDTDKAGGRMEVRWNDEEIIKTAWHDSELCCSTDLYRHVSWYWFHGGLTACCEDAE